MVCPPYDVISPQQQESFHNASPYNFIHILLGKDTPGEDKYKRAAEYFGGWLKEKILVPLSSPAVYFYSQRYRLQGEEKTRQGFVALLSLEDKKKGIYAHEHTRLEPKADRLSLLRQVKANLSPIFVIFPDKKRLIRSLNERYIRQAPPFIEVTDEDHTVHSVWMIDSPEALAYVQETMQQESIFIADGHHRYEVSCAYRDEMLQKLGGRAPSGEEPFNYTLAYFTNTDPRGLTILPIHRFVSLPQPPDLAALKAKLKAHFDIDEVKDKAKFFFMMAKGGRTEHLIGMYHGGAYWLLRLKNVKILNKAIPDKPEPVKSLDVSILNHLILEEMLGLDPLDKEHLTFSQDTEGLLARAASDARTMVFFLNPVSMQQIMAVSLAGEKMPPKSTYFYPKVLSGLLVYRHAQD